MKMKNENENKNEHDILYIFFSDMVCHDNIKQSADNVSDIQLCNRYLG